MSTIFKTPFRTLFAALLAGFMLVGCNAQDGDPFGVGGPGGPGGPGGGPTDLENCSVVVSNLCVLGGDGHGNGLVEGLLDPNGPLGPIVGHLDASGLTNALETLLNNPDGDLASLVENLIAGGQLQDGLTLLLLGDDDGGGLAETLPALLMGGENGDGLVGLFGEEGLAGLVQALLLDPVDPDCQVPLGTLCLITGNGNETGLVNLLLTEDGALAAVSGNLAQDELVAILANLLESDGSLANLAQNLFMEGQLAEGLQALLIGDPENDVPGGLVQALQGLLNPNLVTDLIDFIGGLFGLGGGGGGGGGGSPVDLSDCAVPVTATGLCVLGGAEHGGGLVEELLDPNGPLGPLAGEINASDLTAAIETLLENDDGSLAGLVQNLIAQGQLQEGLRQLLLGDEDGNGGLADSLPALLIGNDDGGGLVGLFGEDGVAGLVQALLIDPADPSCQASLGTLCLITGDGNQTGLVNLLLTDDGALANISDSLTQDELVGLLGDLLESDGSLANLAQNLFMEGQLVAGLQALLIGDPDSDEPAGLVQALQSLLNPSLIEDLIDTIGGLFGIGRG